MKVLSGIVFALCFGALSFGQSAVPMQPTPEEEAAATAYESVAGFLTNAAEAYAAGEAGDHRSALEQAESMFQRGQIALGVGEDVRQHFLVFVPVGNAPETPKLYRAAAKLIREAAEAYRKGDAAKGATKVSSGWEKFEKGAHNDAVITNPHHVAAVLLVILAVLFALNRHASYGKIFKYVPLLVFCYFTPTVFSNVGLIPIASPLYDFIKTLLLPASLALLVLSVDIPAILRLGRPAVILFLTGTLSIVIGGPIAYLICSSFVPDALGDQAWKGLAALSGSWIGGGANFVTIGDSVGATANTISMMVVVDVAVANVWMAVLLFFAGRNKAMDEKIGADRSTVDTVRDKVSAFEKEVSRPTNLPDLLVMFAFAIGATALASAIAANLPTFEGKLSSKTWTVFIVTAIAIVLSFTKMRRLEGAGASKVGSVMLYLLVASIGAHAQFSKVLEVPSLVAVGAVWMFIHAILILIVRRVLKAPVFFAAVGSQANVGGAASAPVVASAFHPSLAPVGVLLAVGGYAIGNYAGFLCARLLEMVHGLVS